jgi:hypothetical protein
MRLDVIVGPEIVTLEAQVGDRVKLILWAGPPGGEVRKVVDGFVTASGELVTPHWDQVAG